MEDPAPRQGADSRVGELAHALWWGRGAGESCLSSKAAPIVLFKLVGPLFSTPELECEIIRDPRKGSSALGTRPQTIVY